VEFLLEYDKQATIKEARIFIEEEYDIVFSSDQGVKITKIGPGKVAFYSGLVPDRTFENHSTSSASLGEALPPLIAPTLPHPSTSSQLTRRRLDIPNMSTTSAPAIRHTLRSCASPLRSQKRWAQVHDVRFVATHQDTNKIVDRYKEKLAQKAKEYAFGAIRI
jgi:hypothetical protein